MKALVDKDACIGCGVCESVCSQVFSTDSEGKAEAISGELDDKLVECAKDAASQCPVVAIEIV